MPDLQARSTEDESTTSLDSNDGPVSENLYNNYTRGETSSEAVQIDDYSSQLSPENRINSARLREYKIRFQKQLLDLIRESEFEFGYNTPVDTFLHDRLDENALATKEWVNLLFIEKFTDVQIATGILRVIAHFDYHEFNPQGPTIALAALSHASLEVRECGIRTLENWGTLQCLEILKTVRCTEQWMKEYVQQVIQDIEESLHVHTC